MNCVAASCAIKESVAGLFRNLVKTKWKNGLVNWVVVVSVGM